MLRITWRNLLARRVRLALSATAIVLGVAFVAGSFIFTDAMAGTFDRIIDGSTSDVEVGYRGANDFGASQDDRTLPASVVHRLEQLPQARAVHATDQLQSVFVIGRDGKVVGGTGAPGLAFNDTGARNVLGEPVISSVAGRLPHGPGQVALDVGTAGKAGYHLGDLVRLATPGRPPTMTARLVGTVRFGTGVLNGATLTVLDRQFLQQRFFGGRDVYTSISLETADGVSQQQLRDAAQRLLPAGVVARTGDSVVRADKRSLARILGFLNKFLLVFAAVSLVVGTFLIVNTFSILVAQRSRELALLRALGASRRQVNTSVLVEAAVVGLFGSTVGLAVGYLLAHGLRLLFATFGLELTGARFPLQLRTVIVSYVVGIVVTVLAAYVPARRASTVPPVAALRDDVALPESSLRRRVLVGLTLVVVGAVAMAAGLEHDGDAGLLVSGAGMLAILVGATLLSPWLGRPLTAGLGRLYRRLFGTVGVLAAQNSARNPRRTAATASALMIGLTLITLMSVLGRSATASTDAAVRSTLTSQFVVSSVTQAPFSPDVARQVRQVDGVRSVAEVRYGQARIGSRTVFVAAVDPRAIGFALAVPMEAGSLLALRSGTVVVSEQAARRHGYRLGSTLRMRLQGATLRLRVVAVAGAAGALPAGYLVTPRTFTAGGLAPLDSLVYVTEDPGADSAAVRRAVERIVEDLPTVTVQDPGEYARAQQQQINVFLNFVYALLALAVVIAVLGIVNTLALSVIERTREVGLLRAVGLSRRQLRQMVRLESVIVAALGAVLGVVLGLVFGIALQRALADQGIDVLSVPWLRLVLFVTLSVVAGVLAAVLPARRAARLDVLRAIASE